MEKLDNIIEKIKKAMRLAMKAGTEGERVAAENAAKRMAEAHGVDLSEIQLKGDSEAKATARAGDKVYRRYGAEVGFAVDIIKRHFGVIIMQYVRPHCNYCRFVFFGVNINIEIAKYVYDIIMREFHKSYREARGWGIKDKRTFMTGWFMQIDRKLTEHPLRNDTEQFEAEKEAAQRKFDEFKSNTEGVKDRKTSPKNGDAETLYRGYMAASNVNLNRPCEGQASESPFALGMTRQIEGRPE